MQTRPQRDGLHRRLLRHAALLAVAPLASPEDETCTASASTSRKITLPPLALRPALPPQHRQRLRRRPSPWPPCRHMPPAREFPAPAKGGGCALLPAHICQI